MSSLLVSGFSCQISYRRNLRCFLFGFAGQEDAVLNSYFHFLTMTPILHQSIYACFSNTAIVLTLVSFLFKSSGGKSISENVKKAYMSYIVNGVHSCYNKAVAYEILNCQPGDIMEYISDQPQSQEGA